jgi:hypothetical protein
MNPSLVPAETPSDSHHADDGEVESGRSRGRRPPGSTHRLSPRFTSAELAEVEAAAARVNMSTARFCAEAALAAVRGEPTSLAAAEEREALARLLRELFAARTAVVRFGTNVNQATTVLNRTGEAPGWLGRAAALCARSVQALDEVTAQVARRLR